MSKHKMGFAQRRDLLVAVLLILAVTIFACFRQTDGMILQFDDEGMILSGPEEAAFTVEVKYEDIISVTGVENIDVGTNLSGVCTDRIWYGTWQNDAYGEYTLCALPSIDRYIVLETANGIVVCNYESRDATQGLYTALLQELAQEQQAG